MSEVVDDLVTVVIPARNEEAVPRCLSRRGLRSGLPKPADHRGGRRLQGPYGRRRRGPYGHRPARGDLDQSERTSSLSRSILHSRRREAPGWFEPTRIPRFRQTMYGSR